jgi:Leucine-rich repeat (LRR) protein
VDDAAVVEQLADGRPIVDLAHPRQRTEGVIAVHWRGSAAVAICGHACRLDRVPATIAALANLERLDLGTNQLTELPAVPAALRELYIHDNQLARLPALPALSVLDANRNRLDELPALTGIDFVYLAGNRLTQLPPITGVRYLNVGENPLARLALCDPALVELRAERAELRTLELGGVTGLRELALRGNAIAALPDSIGALSALRTLDLRANQLDDLPDALRALSLDKLDLRWNPLRRRPDWLDELSRRGCLIYA